VSLIEETSGTQIARCILKAKSKEDVDKFLSVKDDLSLALQSAFSYTRTYISKTDALNIVVELPNAQEEFVYLTEELKECKEELEKLNLPLVLGRDLENNLVIKDITETGSFLMSGATSTGKSMFIDSVIYTLLETKGPNDTKLVILEPKMGLETMQYEGIPNILSHITTDIHKSYELLTKIVKDREENKKDPKHIVILVDEFAILMLSSIGNEFEEIFCKIAKKGKELGIYMFLSSSKPSDTVFTERLRKHIPNRIAFTLATKEDSRRVLGEEGGETLIGNGDMIYRNVNTNEEIRVQAPFISTDKVGYNIKISSTESKIEDYYNNRFRNQFHEWVKQTQAHEHSGEGIYIPHRDLCMEKLSHVPDKDIPLFFCSLGWSVLVDQVMYTYFKDDYPKFQSLTLYPKIEVGITNTNISPGWVFRGYLTKDILNFFLMDLKEFFKKNTFKEASWESVTKVMSEDKDINENIRNEILAVRKL
jgi:hypothetical protein